MPYISINVANGSLVADFPPLLPAITSGINGTRADQALPICTSSR